MLKLTPALQALAIFIIAFVVLFAGVWEPTGLTGKDEFFLGLRTPMEMKAGDHWLVPFLDGIPRIRKPPMLYWLGRLSYETFGVSLVSARLITVLFGAMLVVATGSIARHLSGKTSSFWIASLVLLGCMGLATESRRFMLDVPVAALSTTAFWIFLVWLDSRRFWWLSLSTLLLAAGFLIKGPIVAVVFGGGCLALILSKRSSIRDLQPNFLALALHIVVWASLALPWFFFVQRFYPGAVDLVLNDELEARQFFNISPGIFIGLFNIALPWSFAFCVAAWQQRSQQEHRVLLFWFAFTFFPFMAIKSFDRYLIGSLVPVAILLSFVLPTLSARWPFRLGALLSICFGGLLAFFVFWFRGDAWLWLIGPALYLAWAWWNFKSLVHTLISPIVYWVALLWGVFPAIGVNAIPDHVVVLASQKSVAFFSGPQPALLPILSRQVHRHYSRFDTQALETLSNTNTLIFVEEIDLESFRENLSSTSFEANEIGSYQSLASHGSGLRFARIGATSSDWLYAITNRTLDPLMTRIFWFDVQKK